LSAISWKIGNCYQRLRLVCLKQTTKLSFSHNHSLSVQHWLSYHFVRLIEGLAHPWVLSAGGCGCSDCPPGRSAQRYHPQSLLRLHASCQHYQNIYNLCSDRLRSQTQGISVRNLIPYAQVFGLVSILNCNSL
jgi:hypothetical protein